MKILKVDDKNSILIEDTDTMICGLYKWYDSDMCFCDIHLNWGELCERDFCDDYEECD